MPVFQPTYRDPKMGKQTKSAVWWYDFTFAGKRIRESAKTTLKTLARMAEQKRHRELEQGFNGLADKRDERIRTITELADEYLAEYKLRHKSLTFAEYVLGNVKRHLGEQMAVEVAEKTVKTYQSDRLKEKAAPKTINEEVGFLLRLLGDQGDGIRARLRRQKALKQRIVYRRSWTLCEVIGELPPPRRRPESTSTITPFFFLIACEGRRSAVGKL